MTNVEQFINYNKTPCYQKTSDNLCKINVPKKISEYLITDNFLSEYNTDIEKALAMLNLLLLDSVPTKDSTRLVTSGTVFKLMREMKSLNDLLLILINNLQLNKADKTETIELLSGKVNSNDLHRVATTGSYNDLTDKPSKLSDFTNDLDFPSLLLYDPTELINLINSKPDASDIPTKISLLTNDVGYINLHLDISNKADKSELSQVGRTGNYNDLQNKPTILLFIIIKESDYEALTEYVKDAVYLVIEDDEPETTGWRLGDGLPIILSGDWKFGDNLPIILN